MMGGMAAHILLVVFLIHSISACPEHCRCSGHSVSCPDSAVIPDGIPEDTLSLSFISHLFINLPSNTFVLHRLHNLDLLQIEYGNLEVIGPNAFHGLPSLKLLHLRANNINSIDSKAFNGLSRLNILYLTGNRLQQLAPRQFDGLSSLTWLSLSNNQLQGITPNAFIGLVNLESLYLRNNMISELTTYQSFTGLRKLTLLTLNSNKVLQNIGDRVFSQLKSLEKLELGDNQISGMKLTQFTFAGLDNLRLLNLNENPLATVPSEAFKPIPQLHVLYMNQAELEFIHPGAFQYLPNLMELTLDRNYHLYSIPTDCFHNMPDLQVLKLSQTNIQELHSTIFAKANRLYRLEISKTSLSKIYPGVFANTTNIHDLDLSNNQLTSLPSEIFESIPYTPSLHIDIHNNPWLCDCHLPEFISSTNKHFTASELQKIFTISKKQPNCMNPPNLAYTPIFKVPLLNLTCAPVVSSTKSDTHKVAYITTGCLGSVVAIATVFVIVVFWKKCKGSKLSEGVQYGSQRNIMSLPLNDDVSVNELDV